LWGGWRGLPIVAVTDVVTFRGENSPLPCYGSTLKIEVLSSSENSTTVLTATGL